MRRKKSTATIIKRLLVGGAGLFLVVMPLLQTPLAAADPGMPSITDYPVPTANSNPINIVTSSTGYSYFSELAVGQIGQIDQAGNITEYALPSNIPDNTPNPEGIALGANPGEVIYTDSSDNAIGDLDTTTGTAVLHPIPTANAGPVSIASDCNGNYWFTEYNKTKIGRLAANGKITEYSIPGGIPNQPNFITAGPNTGPGCTENMWFTEGNSGTIGEIDQTGTITQYVIPDTSSISPGGITTGPDGALWFTAGSNTGSSNVVGRVTTTGDFTLFTLPDVDNAPDAITTGPDGALWFANDGGELAPYLGRMTTDGQVTNYTTPHASPEGISLDPTTSALWFTERNDGYIGRAQIPPAGPTNLTATSSTSAPVLNWDGVSGASAYNIYRNGTQIDTVDGSTTTYTDASAVPGSTYSYFVTAMINGTESEASNTVSASVEQSPTITSAASTTASAGAPLNFTMTTSGSPTPSISQSGNLPAGITFTDNGDGTASLSGTPALGSAGTYPFTISADNGIGNPASQAFTLTVNNNPSAPGFTSASSDNETYNVPFSFTVTTNGNPAPAITKSGALPKGITFTDNGDGTATIAGTPSAASDMGTYNLTLKAKNQSGIATQAFTLTITKAPVIKNIGNKTAYVGTPFSMTIKSTGYYTPSLDIAEGVLPAGLNFVDNGDGTATISGTPEQYSGNKYSLEIEATNQLGTSSQQFTLTVNEAPTFVSPDSASATEGSAFSFQASAAGNPNVTYQEAGKLPKGVSFNRQSGTFNGTPAAGSAGTYNLVLTAKNSMGSATQNFTLTVQSS